MIPKTPKHNRIREGRHKDKAYLIHVSEQPCLCCGVSPTQAHHPIANSSRRKYGKAHDKTAVPLCFKHHVQLHDIFGCEDDFEIHYGLDFEGTGNELWKEYKSRIM